MAETKDYEANTVRNAINSFMESDSQEGQYLKTV